MKGVLKNLITKKKNGVEKNFQKMNYLLFEIACRASFEDRGSSSSIK